MSQANLEKGLAMISQHATRAHFVGPRSEELVARAETALGLRLPPTYREFVRRLGAGNFGAAEFYGVIDENFSASSVPNGVWLTLDERRSAALPKNYVIVASSGTGEYYCLDVRDQGEAPVVIMPPGETVPSEQVASDFGDFFWNEVRQQAERLKH